MPNINRFILKGVALLLSFSLGFLVSLALIAYNPKIVSYTNYYYKFFILQVFNKKLITQKIISGDKVYFYSEILNGEIVKIANFDKLEPIIKEAYDDFPIFIYNKYKITLPEIKDKSLIITFVRKETYRTYEIAQEPGNAFTEDNRIFFKCDEFKLNVVSRKSNIRHETFHYLEGKYGIKFLPDQDAFDFESWVKE